MTRTVVLSDLAVRIAGIKLDHPVRVAIDGVDAAGKTSLAGELHGLLIEYDRPVVQASIDQFHNSEAVRYSQGRTSPLGYFEDSFNYDALIEDLLKPLGQEGNRFYRTSSFDYKLDQKKVSKAFTAAGNCILLFDGIFLLRSELREYWDFSIFVSVPIEISLSRALSRDLSSKETASSIEQLYRERYIPGQQVYLDSCQPELHANIIMRNEPVDSPTIEVVRQ